MKIVEEVLYLTCSSVLLKIWNFGVSNISKEASLGGNEKSCPIDYIVFWVAISRAGFLPKLSQQQTMLREMGDFPHQAVRKSSSFCWNGARLELKHELGAEGVESLSRGVIEEAVATEACRMLRGMYLGFVFSTSQFNNAVVDPLPGCYHSQSLSFVDSGQSR